MRKDDVAIETARINARQAILVAVITGIVTLITTLIVTGNLLPGHGRDQTSAGAGESVPHAPVLNAPYLYFSTKRINLSLEMCMEKARAGLERARLTGQDAKGFFAWGYRDQTTGLIWCHTDEEIVIFMAAGRDEGEASQTAEALRRSF